MRSLVYLPVLIYFFFKCSFIFSHILIYVFERSLDGKLDSYKSSTIAEETMKCGKLNTFLNCLTNYDHYSTITSLLIILRDLDNVDGRPSAHDGVSHLQMNPRKEISAEENIDT